MVQAASSNRLPAAAPRRQIFRSFAGWSSRDLPRDVAVGLTLAAIAIPEQMANARLAGFTPEIGLYAFAAASLAFAILGVNRFLSVGADSTIAPIFAGSLALLAASGSAHYAALAAALALAVGVIVVGAGLARMGWIANLLSEPVTTGFLAGIAIHIAASQLPALLSVPAGDGNVLHRLLHLGANVEGANLWTVAIGLGVLAITFATEKLNPRVPGALVGLVAATAAVLAFGLENRGVAVLGVVPGGLPNVSVPALGAGDFLRIAPLSLLVAIVVMVQTSATTRGFTPANEEPDINRDFIGVGAGSILAGFLGAFPVDASPPRTAIVSEAHARSQATGLVAACVILALAVFGPSLMRHVPAAALAGILLFVALRITRVSTMHAVFRESPGEFALIVATIAAITVLPIQTGVAVGIALSLLHGLYTTTRARVLELARVPGTSIWWPPQKEFEGESLEDVRVLAFQAPLSFLNAYDFRRGVHAAIAQGPQKPTLVVLEASSIVEIDYTAAQAVAQIIEHCREANIVLAVARLESVRAQDALQRFGILKQLGENRVFHSVDEAIRALRPTK
jgi:MFS superfamily sulfate permease-like transporter